MNPAEYAAYCQTRGLSDDAVRVIDGIRAAAPSRRVGRRAGNVAGRFVSPSMGWVIQSESRTVEWRWIYLMEFSPDVCPSWGRVVEYWDQPPPIVLRYRSKNQRPVGPIRYTPDFFVLAEHFTGWVECKPERILQKRAASWPSTSAC